MELKDEAYDVCIDASLEPGHLTFGEYYIKGQSDQEVLISTHICHPSLCNDNLSGVALSTFLAKYLSQFSLRYSYRFLFVPGTIGSIAWLSLKESRIIKIKHGLVIAGVGDSGKSTYKRSRQGNAEIDTVVIHVLKHSGQDFEVLDFTPYGYDERQYAPLVLTYRWVASVERPMDGTRNITPLLTISALSSRSISRTRFRTVCQ